MQKPNVGETYLGIFCLCVWVEISNFRLQISKKQTDVHLKKNWNR